MPAAAALEADVASFPPTASRPGAARFPISRCPSKARFAVTAMHGATLVNAASAYREAIRHGSSRSTIAVGSVALSHRRSRHTRQRASLGERREGRRSSAGIVTGERLECGSTPSNEVVPVADRRAAHAAGSRAAVRYPDGGHAAFQGRERGSRVTEVSLSSRFKAATTVRLTQSVTHFPDSTSRNQRPSVHLSQNS